jgi:hypothetical protein
VVVLVAGVDILRHVPELGCGIQEVQLASEVQIRRVRTWTRCGQPILTRGAIARNE